jgi:predicted TIM-barrel fold metal-dependent hydrolase
LDRATAFLPKLTHTRMDEIGLDFAIVYPSLGLFVLTLPGIGDDELRQASARAFNNYNAEMFRGFGDCLTPAALIPMHTPREAIAELEHAVKTLGLKATVFAADVLRPVPKPQKNPAALAELYYYDCFGIDSPYDYDPVWRKVHRASGRADLSFHPHRPRHAGVDQPPSIQPTQRLCGRRGGSLQVPVFRRRDPALS